jgi:hypothetical protein
MLWCMPSTEAAAYLVKAGMTGKLDFVYLDADHAHASVKADLAAWFPLVKSGGVFAGHDWVANGWHRPDEPLTAYPTHEDGGPMSVPFGVIDAVTEFALANDLQISITGPGDCGGWLSWACAKP